MEKYITSKIFLEEIQPDTSNLKKGDLIINIENGAIREIHEIRFINFLEKRMHIKTISSYDMNFVYDIPKKEHENYFTLVDKYYKIINVDTYKGESNV
jgi:hypothetical protein